MSGNTSILSESVIDLLHYVLTSPKFHIESVPRSRYDDVLKLTKNTTVKVTSKPSHVFKVNYRGEWKEEIVQGEF
jgi:hypothetical protein